MEKKQAEKPKEVKADKKAGAEKKVVKEKKAAKGEKKEVKEPTGKQFKATVAHLFEAKPRNYRIGRDIQPAKDLTRFLKWPAYVRLQRQKTIIKKRLKVPPAVNQFTKTLDLNHAQALFKLLANYRPETPAEKHSRLAALAKIEAKKTKKPEQKDDKKDEKKEVKKEEKKPQKPKKLKFGLNHVTSLVESKKAKLVVIAHDVDPIDLVVWLPALCRKMDIPYCIVKSKSRLGTLVHQKTCTAVALTDLDKKDQRAFEQLIQVIKPMYNENTHAWTKWGGGLLGIKARARMKKQGRAVPAN
jgi:large subunit ribosomal protein L7Ae